MPRCAWRDRPVYRLSEAEKHLDHVEQASDPAPGSGIAVIRAASARSMKHAPDIQWADLRQEARLVGLLSFIAFHTPVHQRAEV